MIYYERNLPHWQPPGATFFLTYRLHGSIPITVLEKIRANAAVRERDAREQFTGTELNDKLYEIQRRWFAGYDNALDHNSSGPYWLSDPANAALVAESLHWCAERYFKLWAFCIMSNHVHVLMKHRKTAPLLNIILKRHKGYTGLHCNKTLGRHGKYWQEETYDHVVRNDTEFQRIWHYIVMNPVKAGLVTDWRDWPWTFSV